MSKNIDEEDTVLTQLTQMISDYIAAKSAPKKYADSPFKVIDFVVQVSSTGKCTLHLMGDSSLLKNQSVYDIDNILDVYNLEPSGLYEAKSLANPNIMDVYIGNLHVNGYNVIIYTDRTFMITSNDYAVGETTMSDAQSAGSTHIYCMK